MPVTSQGDELQKEPGDHNHGGDAANLEIAKFMDRLRDSSRTTQDTPQYLVSSLSSSISNGSVGRLPQLSSIKRTIRNDLVIPEVYKQTLSGENFLQFDSGHLEWESRMLIFATQRSRNALERSERWYMDGTFKTVPQIFAQLYTIHGLKDNLSIPLVYVLLPDKTEGSYSRMLQKIKDLCSTATPINNYD
ncbi:hypothetical protein QE152_g20838 [Popillia japonica]|uniref:MULE transposase domain-containing protein n=1 Tax=Popillia japonica TaxID=7064 RepID=A0AAW1KLX4_POPJA